MSSRKWQLKSKAEQSVTGGAYYFFSHYLEVPDYTGALIEIERSSDNATKAFYPDGSGKLSLTSEDGSGTSLSTWISTDDGYVRTWYDQSGNGINAVQTTYANQPQIISGGSFLTLGGEVRFRTTSSRYLDLSITPADWTDSDLTNFFLGAITGLNAAVISTGGSGYLWYDRSFSDMDFRHNGTVGNIPRPTSGAQILFSFFYDFSASLIEVFFDNVTQGTDTLDGNWVFANQRLGGDANNTDWQVFATYNQDKSAERSNISNSINSNYSVY